jgi:energy-coupling factor transporter ATP-binding protein EcfA2
MAGFQKAKREKIWVKVLLGGSSGSGKSYTSLRIATGIASQCNGKVAAIDTENGRIRYYANEFDFDDMQLEEPYTPEKYIEAIDMAVHGGYKVLVIDSTTHEWKYINDIHDKMPGNSFTNWGKVKPRHAAFMEKLLQAPIHTIITTRGKDEYVMEDKNGKQVPKKVGIGMQQEKDIEYNYTVTFNIAQDTHVAEVMKDNTHLFENRYDVLTEKDGVALYKWANSGEEQVAKPKVTIVPPSEEDTTDELKDTKKEIVLLCTTLGGTKNETLMTTLKNIVQNGNPNSIKDLDTAKQLLEALQSLQQ